MKHEDNGIGEYRSKLYYPGKGAVKDPRVAQEGDGRHCAICLERARRHFKRSSWLKLHNPSV